MTFNRSLLLKIGAGAAAVAALTVILWYAVERWQKHRFDQRVAALEQQAAAADKRATEAQAAADAAKSALAVKEAELRAAEQRAEAAERSIQQTRDKAVSLKRAYEAIRNNTAPLPAADVDSTCAKLAALGQPCR